MNKTPLKFLLMRQQKYLDHSIQGWMIGLMVLTQVAFVIAGIIVFNQELSSLLEQHIYSIHGLEMKNINSQLEALSVKIIVAYLGLNLFGLLVAHLVWVKYIVKVLKEFDTLVNKSKQFDFVIDKEPSVHIVIEAAKTWREREREKWKKISSRVKSLPANELEFKEQQQNAIIILNEIRSLLKQRSK